MVFCTTICSGSVRAQPIQCVRSAERHHSWLILVANDQYITAASVCDLLRQIAAKGYALPVTLILDNARYQKYALVQDLAISLGIELLYLPTYSPNLNLIERLWKFVKKECLYSKYHENFAQFKHAIASCLAQTHTTHKAELDTLLVLEFQTFKKSHLVPR